MSASILLDTNLWVYLYAEIPESHSATVKQLVERHFRRIACSTQVLGELYNVLTRKHLLSEERAKEVVNETIATFPILAITATTVQQAITIHEQYGYSYWDSLILATALLHNLATVYSEDMQHDQRIDGKTRIINPFVMKIAVSTNQTSS